MAVHVRAGVQKHERTLRIAVRQDGRDRRTLHARNAPQRQDRARRDRAGVARRHERIGAPLLHEPHRDVDRAVALLADGLDRRLVHRGDVRRVDDLQRALLDHLLGRRLQLRRQLLKLRLDRGELPDEQDLHVRHAGRRLDGANHNLFGGVVAAHRIQRHARHSFKPPFPGT